MKDTLVAIWVVIHLVCRMRIKSGSKKTVKTFNLCFCLLRVDFFAKYKLLSSKYFSCLEVCANFHSSYLAKYLDSVRSYIVYKTDS